MQDGISGFLVRCFFQYEKIYQWKDGKNLILFLLKNKLEWNLKELPQGFLIKKSGIKFRS